MMSTMRSRAGLALFGAGAACLWTTAATACDDQAVLSKPGAAIGAQATQMMTFGLNVIGQLGVGHDRPMAAPVGVVDLDNSQVTRVSLGDNASAAITSQGALYVWGSGQYGRLGHGDESALNLPRVNEHLLGTTVVEVAIGGFHAVALDDHGAIYTWGRGIAVGQDTNDSVLVPQRMGGDIAKTKIVKVAAGRLHCAAVGEDGSVWTWGNNYEGELGHGDKKQGTVPRRVDELRGLRAQSVACGRDFTVVLMEDGTLYTCGADDYGQLGQGRGHGERYVKVPRKVVGGLADVKEIAAGDMHSCALTNSGTVFTWGIGREGQLGHGEKTDQAIPKQVEALGDKVVEQVLFAGPFLDKTLPAVRAHSIPHEGWALRAVDIALTRVGVQPENPPKVCCGGGHTGAVTASGDIYLWGRGRDGQLGRGGELESIAAYRVTPRRVESLAAGAVLQADLGTDHSAVLVKRDQ